MKLIPLTQGQAALVDDADFEWLNQWKWLAKKQRDGGFYAARAIPDPKRPGKQKDLYMHRLIANTPEGFDTDHQDENRLNNQRGNLRTCSQSQNKANCKPYANNSSGFKGAYFHARDKIWEAHLRKDRKCIYLGRFLTAEAAARAYDTAALAHFGEFAQLNFPVIQPVLECLPAENPPKV